MTWGEIVMFAAGGCLGAGVTLMFCGGTTLLLRRLVDAYRAMYDKHRDEWVAAIAQYDPQTAEALRRRFQGWPL